MKKLLSLVCLLALVFSIGTLSTFAQIRYRVAAGLSTSWVPNDNPATYRLTGRISTTDSLNAGIPYGGGLDGLQNGIGVKVFIDLDKQKTYRIPLGIDYHAYRGAQGMATDIYSMILRHSVDIWTGIAGFEYSFVEFPMAFARAFVGTEVRGSIVGASKIERTLENYDFNGNVISSATERFSQKSAVFRLGGAMRLGIEGELYYPVFLNTSISYGVLNVLGRDSRGTVAGGRGELLTPDRLNEGAESVVHQVNFTFMIQVRL